MSTGNRKSDWGWNDDEIEKAIAELVNNCRIDRTFDIPYLAGYSKDGKTFYIDKDFQWRLIYKGKLYDMDRYLLVHEAVEKAIIAADNLNYAPAHQIALTAERRAVEADGLPWSVEDAYMQRYIKSERKNIQRVPRDLDLTPYEQEGDTALVEHMKQKMV